MQFTGESSGPLARIKLRQEIPLTPTAGEKEAISSQIVTEMATPIPMKMPPLASLPCIDIQAMMHYEAWPQTHILTQ